MIITEELLNNNFEPSAVEIEDKSKYKYVLYARKSTKDEGRQVRSIPDQIKECKDHASRNGLKVVDTIQENQSARVSEIRPKFRQLLEDIESGTYDGILAWHPDRLARNMKEAGEIIDLIDRGVIKSLEFRSFTFTNDASGKLLLGIAFALSKNYSDNLSVNVKRGNRNILAKGGTLNVSKHGYYRDADGKQFPDEANYDLISQAFQMRLQGTRQKDIADFLNKNNYTNCKVKNKKNRVKVKFNDKMVSKMLEDSFYCGFFKHGQSFIKLSDKYNFTPAVSLDEFKILNLDKFKSPRQEKRATLLNGKVLCSECGSTLSSGITPKKTKQGKVTNYYYYRCDNKECSRKGKSTRAKVIVDHTLLFFENLKIKEKNKFHKHYLEEVSRLSVDKKAQLLSEENRLNARLHGENEHIKSLKKTLREETDKSIKELYRDDLKLALRGIEVLDVEKSEIIKQKESIDGAKLSLEKLLELFENMPSHIQKAKTLKELDQILTKVFMNFTVDGEKVLSYQLEEPFNSMYNDGFFSLAGAEGIEPPLMVLETIVLPLYDAPITSFYNKIWSTLRVPHAVKFILH